MRKIITGMTMYLLSNHPQSVRAQLSLTVARHNASWAYLQIDIKPDFLTK